MPYIIQNNAIYLPTEPFARDAAHYVSLREVIEALGGSVVANDDKSVFTATIGPWVATITANDANITVTGDGQSVPIRLTAEPYAENDQMFVPIDFFEDAYGYDVRLSDDNTMTIINPNAT